MAGSNYPLGKECKVEFHDRLRREGRFHHYSKRKTALTKGMGMSSFDADVALYDDYPPQGEDVINPYIAKANAVRAKAEEARAKVEESKVLQQKELQEAKLKEKQLEQAQKDEQIRLEREARENEFIAIEEAPFGTDIADPSEAIQWAASKMKIKGMSKEDAPSSTAWFILQHAQSSRLNEEKFWHNLYPKIFARIERELADAKEREREDEERRRQEQETRQAGDVSDLIERLSGGD